jgi:SAM-dependent methyltransferase
VLHFAPEPALTQAFHRLPGITYVSLDLCNPRVTIRANAEHLPFTSEAFDLIYCSHVLEHVPDDRTAMHEMYRVMRCGGVAIILIPLWNKPTYEDQSITDPCERERLFGQFDHVRWYGLDIIERLTDAGFAVQTVRIGDVAHACAIEHFGLDANEILFVCTIGQPRMSPLTDLLQPEGEHP